MFEAKSDKAFDLQGRRALVTGSSQGIGLALAYALGKAGATVVLNGRQAEKTEAAAAQLREEGIAVETSIFDVTVNASVKEAIDGIESALGPIDILVNNAGTQRRAPLEDFPEAQWHELIQTNLNSVFYVSQAVARFMIPRGRGKIINICSVQSELARPSIAPYTATKGAVKMLTKGMCADWAKHGLQINGLGPGYFATELNKPLADNQEFSDWLCKRTPAGRWGKVEELGPTAVFLASAASNFINGQIIYVDGGLTATV